MVLVSRAQLIPSSIYKNSTLSHTLMQKNLELVPYNLDQDFGFNFSLRLLPSVYGLVLQVTHGKGDSIVTMCTKYSKIIFVLMNQVIALYMRLTQVHI